MSNCRPLVYLNLCDDNVEIAASTVAVRLKVYKNGELFEQISLTPSSGKIYLSKANINKFADTYHMFRAILIDATNEIIPFTAMNCAGDSMDYGALDFRFKNCETPNTKLLIECE